MKDVDLTDRIQGAYQFSEINLRPFLRRFKTDFFQNLRPVCTMNDKQVWRNGASAATQEIRLLISENFPGAMIFLTTCYNIFVRPF